MIEVAIVSMEQALEADGESLPVGSGALARDRMVLPGAGQAGTAGGVEPGPAETTGGAAVTIDPPVPGA
jgi:hypothetical protein